MRFGWMLVALVVLPLPGAAQSLADYDYDNLRFRGIGVDYGFIWPSKVNSTAAYSLRLDLGYLGPAVRISPSVTYWSSELKIEELDRLANQLEQLPVLRDQNVTVDAENLGIIQWSDLSLALDAHVVWTAPFNVFTYIGAGIALHTLNGRGDFIEDTFIEDLLDSTTAGVALSAGAEIQPLPYLRFYGEARYSVASDVRYPGMRVGVALMLPPANPAASAPTGAR